MKRYYLTCKPPRRIYTITDWHTKRQTQKKALCKFLNLWTIVGTLQLNTSISKEWRPLPHASFKWRYGWVFWARMMRLHGPMPKTKNHFAWCLARVILQWRVCGDGTGWRSGYKRDPKCNPGRYGTSSQFLRVDEIEKYIDRSRSGPCASMLIFLICNALR